MAGNLAAACILGLLYAQQTRAPQTSSVTHPAELHRVGILKRRAVVKSPRRRP
jgi:hypothetical protein